jgi:hypothetical protein
VNSKNDAKVSQSSVDLDIDNLNWAIGLKPNRHDSLG